MVTEGANTPGNGLAKKLRIHPGDWDRLRFVIRILIANFGWLSARLGLVDVLLECISDGTMLVIASGRRRCRPV